MAQLKVDVGESGRLRLRWLREQGDTDETVRTSCEAVMERHGGRWERKPWGFEQVSPITEEELARRQFNRRPTHDNARAYAVAALKARGISASLDVPCDSDLGMLLTARKRWPLGKLLGVVLRGVQALEEART